MKPAPFEYECPDSLQEAVALLARIGGDAKIIAGGQSLMPMLNFRVVRPGTLVDIGRVLELDFVRETADGGLSLGALTRHRVLETSPLVARRFPVIPEAMRHVAHLAIRNRGTLGGSLSHADPAAELPMLALLLEARIVAVSGRGEREIEAADFLVGSLANALEEDEIVVRVELPGLTPGAGWGFEEVARRPGDFALAAVGVHLALAGGMVTEARIAMMGVGETALRRREAEACLVGQPMDEALAARATRLACEGLSPNLDLHASPDLRRHLAAVLCDRVLRKAWRRAKGGAA